MRLFSNTSQRTSKCGKNISGTLSCALCATFLFLPHFDVICDILLNRRTATWNLFVKSILWFQVAIAFWRALGGSEEEIAGLGENDGDNSEDGEK